MREILCFFSDFSPKNQFKIRFTVHWLRNTYKFFFVYLLYFCVRASVRAFFWRQDVWVYCLCLELCMIHQNGMQFLSTTNSRIFINRQASNFFSCFEVWRGISCLFIINKRSIEGDNIRLERYFLLLIERQVTFFHVLKSGEVFLVCLL